MSSRWKKIKLAALQEMVNKRKVRVVPDETPITHHKRCPTCKKGKLITVLLFDGRYPPEKWIILVSISKSKE